MGLIIFLAGFFFFAGADMWEHISLSDIVLALTYLGAVIVVESWSIESLPNSSDDRSDFDCGGGDCDCGGGDFGEFF